MFCTWLWLKNMSKKVTYFMLIFSIKKKKAVEAANQRFIWPKIFSRSGFLSTGAYAMRYLKKKNCGTRDLTHMLITEQHENPLQNRDLDSRGLTNPSTRDTRNNIIILFFLCSSNEWSISDKCPTLRSLRDNVRKLLFLSVTVFIQNGQKAKESGRISFCSLRFFFAKW